jgi:hypothetical protein
MDVLHGALYRTVSENGLGRALEAVEDVGQLVPHGSQLAAAFLQAGFRPARLWFLLLRQLQQLQLWLCCCSVSYSVAANVPVARVSGLLRSREVQQQPAAGHLRTRCKLLWPGWAPISVFD